MSADRRFMKDQKFQEGNIDVKEDEIYYTL